MSTLHLPKKSGKPTFALTTNQEAPELASSPSNQELRTDSMSITTPEANDSGTTDTARAPSLAPTLAAVDPFDPSLFSVTSTAAAMATKKVLTHCKVDKPAKTAFVRASSRPEDCVQIAVLLLKEEGETYLLSPDVAAELPGLASFVSLTVAIDRQGNPFLWLTKSPQEGKDNAWNRSMREAQTVAKKRWVRVESNMSSGAYDLYEASAGIAEPVWPPYTVADYLRVAFGDAFVIREITHPMIQRLLGNA